MRIQSQYFFYLDFQLPAFTGIDEPSVGVEYQDQRVVIVPWNRKEPLFYGELGQALQAARFSISPVGVPDARLTRRVADVSIDRLLVAVEWEHDNDSVGDAGVIEAKLEEAVTYANFFIGHLRAVTGSAHLKPVEVYWNPEDRTLAVQVPYSVQWINYDTGALLQVFDGLNGQNSAGGIRIPCTGVVGWSTLLNSMGTGTLPPFHLSLLVDAKEALITGSLREAILCIASACEVCMTNYLEAQTIISAAKAQAIVKPHAGLSFARRYFDLLPMATCGRSLDAFDPQSSSDVDSCYRVRNGLMHKGDLPEPLRGMSVTDRLRVVSRWRQSAEKALAWADSLPTTK